MAFGPPAVLKYCCIHDPLKWTFNRMNILYFAGSALKCKKKKKKSFYLGILKRTHDIPPQLFSLCLIRPLVSNVCVCVYNLFLIGFTVSYAASNISNMQFGSAA